MRSVALRGGIGLGGVEILISNQEELEGRGLFGHTSPDGLIALYPDAFADEEQLSQTLGHERIHVMQMRIFGPPLDSGMLLAFEQAAWATEVDWLRFFRGDY
ncbi:MAG: hypothetical protein ACR2PL_00160 [Dehalococcoidia bacterium]